MTEAEVYEAVDAELGRARSLHPWWPNRSIVHAAAIASEESGEVVKAANNWYWRHGGDTMDDIQAEAVQAIAMWMRFLTEGDYTRED